MLTVMQPLYSFHALFTAKCTLQPFLLEGRFLAGTCGFLIIIIIYNIYRALIPNGPKALYIIEITTKS